MSAVDHEQSPEVLCIGETMLLVAPAEGGELSLQHPALLGVAGAESNVAMNLAGLGHRAAWASRLGGDPLGSLVLDAITTAGVDTNGVERFATHPTGAMFKFPSAAGTTVQYYRAGSAASAMSAEFADALSRRFSPRIVHVTGITPALSADCAELVRHILVDRPFGPALVSFDVNHRPTLWADDAPDALLALARLADVVFVGLDEAERLWGCGTAAEVGELIGAITATDATSATDARTAADARNATTATDARTVVIKDSDREAVAITATDVVAEPALPIEVLEPVGAGDAFAAGWLSGLLRGLDQRGRLRLGHRVAASVLVSAGDQGVLPSDEELAAHLGIGIEEWLRRGSSDV